MKRKLCNKFLTTVFLVTIMVMFFTGCSGKEEEEKTQGEKKSQNIESEYLYQSSFQNINVGVESISNVYKKDDMIYLSGSEWVEDKEDEDGGKLKTYFIHCTIDGSDLQRVELKGANDEYVTAFIMNDKEQFLLLTQQYDYNEKTQESKSRYYVHTLNKKGKISNTIELKPEKISDEDYFYPISGRTLFLNGTIYIASGNNIYRFDEKGKAGKVSKIKEIGYIERLIMSDDGKVYIYGSIDGKYGLSEFDLNTEKLGNCIEFQDYSIYEVKSVYFGEENKIYLGDGNNLYCIDLSTGEVKEEINWLNSDINGDNIIDCFFLEDGKFFAITSNYDESKREETTEFVTLNKIKASDIKEKKIIKFACAYLEYNVKNQILSFNKTNQDYRIEVKSYDNYENATEKMNMDIVSGNIPDILDVSMGVSKEQMIKKGMFTDLYSFIEKDKEIKKEDFIPSVLKTIETEEKLYYLSPFFSIGGLVTEKKTMGDNTEWSIDDMIKMYDDMPEDSVFMTCFMENMTKQLFMRNIIAYEMEDYINYSTGEIRFNSEEFIQLMQFADHFPDEEEISDENYMANMPALVEKGKLVLNELSLSSIGDIEMYTKLYKKRGGYTVLGYPTKEKSDRIAMNFGSNAFAILEQSDKKEGAWEFLRQFYTYDYQKNPNRYGFPTRQDALEKRLEYAQATKAYIDEDGTRVEPINMAYGYDNYTVEIGPINEKEAEMIRSLMERIGICASYDIVVESIYNIINEEIKAFFTGDKSAEETAEIIQNRVNIYISENS